MESLIMTLLLSVSEIILKISQYLMKLYSYEIWRLTFLCISPGMSDIYTLLAI